MEPVPLTEWGSLPPDYVLDDPDSHYIYVCKKVDRLYGLSNTNTEKVRSTIVQ